MERLTNGIEYCKLHCDFGKSNECFFSNKDKCYERSIYNRLKEYEDADEQGLLLRLPCKVGDTVYVKMASYCDIQYAEAEVRDFTHFTSCGFCAVITSKHFDKQNIPFSEIGKTVFLTKAEAEQKLKEMESDSNG